MTIDQAIVWLRGLDNGGPRGPWAWRVRNVLPQLLAVVETTHALATTSSVACPWDEWERRRNAVDDAFSAFAGACAKEQK